MSFILILDEICLNFLILKVNVVPGIFRFRALGFACKNTLPLQISSILPPPYERCPRADGD